jgi:flagellar biosynthesis protein FlhF
LKTYADILEVPIEIIFTADEIQKNESKYEDLDYIFIDTAGRSHKNQTQMAEMAQLLQSEGEKTVFLVLNMNTTWRDIKHILDTYNALIDDFSLIVTKLDETDVIGNLLNIAYYAKKPIAYTTHGQNVPDDFKIFDRKEYMKQLLGGCMG